MDFCVHKNWHQPLSFSDTDGVYKSSFDLSPWGSECNVYVSSGPTLPPPAQVPRRVVGPVLGGRPTVPASCVPAVRCLHLCGASGRPSRSICPPPRPHPPLLLFVPSFAPCWSAAHWPPAGVAAHLRSCFLAPHACPPFLRLAAVVGPLFQPQDSDVSLWLEPLSRLQL